MAPSDTIEITIPSYGVLRGAVDHVRRIATFRNVPYATVPERWRPAVKPDSWTGVRDATKQGPKCPQLTPPIPMDIFFSQDYREDKNECEIDHDEKHCLNLNISVPLESLSYGAKPIPVMTWVHGGGNIFGYNSFALYDPSNFVHHSIQLNQPVIIVSVNYRLNILGFLASKELEQDMIEYAAFRPFVSSCDQAVGNWALMDQRLAFEWVRENISVFGGNSRNITAWSESAGAADLHHHMLIPAHHGLFDQVILESGTVETMPPGHIKTEGQLLFDTLLQKLSIPLDLDGKEKLRRLRATPVTELILAGAAANQREHGESGPFYDGGKVLPSDIPIQSLARNPAAYDPNLKSVLIGTNKNEGSVFTRLYGDLTLQSWPLVFKRLVPREDLAPLFEAAYGVPETDNDVARIVETCAGDVMFNYGTQALVDTLVKLSQSRGNEGFKLTWYNFDVQVELVKKFMPEMGAMHIGELPFVFSPPSVQASLTVEELAFSKEMQKIWIGFANQQELVVKTADGSGKRAVAVEDGEAIIFGANREIQIGKGRRLSKEALAFLEKFNEFLEQPIREALATNAVY
ncbi:hypothetical protein BGX26_010139 [Mortierella sp. AD094]|nr:hypothetical protein BGX26_010139 [Mortierella sp. AD094]